ncbi:DUF3450 domain-containing protein [Gammaproteobacteria bacterium]|nr:DUF3450 domain-containing protein [Gammaproteobacteria bacterium]
MNKFYSLFLISFITIGITSQEVVEDTPTRAELIDTAINLEASSSSAAANRQDTINNLDSQIIFLTGEIQYLSQQLDLTNIYNRQLQELIDSQNSEIKSINEQMEALDETNRGILPKLEEMVNILAEVIEKDTPFLIEERSQRVNEIKDLLTQSNISTSEKFRRVFEAYQIENEYGRTVEAYRDEIIVDGQNYNVEIFRLGRVGLYGRTADGDYTAMYSRSENKWIKVKGIDDDLVIALKIARKEIPPSLIKLPLEKI